MGRAPCCDKNNVKKGPWSPEEDAKLKVYIEKNGTGGNWIALPQKIGLKRCGKSCRLRWLNYLRPNIKHGGFSEEEDNLICSLYISIGSRWSIIAAQLPGRTDNDIKNYWNTKLKKKLLGKEPWGSASCHDGIDKGRTSNAQSASALERMMLHKKLQGHGGPFSFYNNPSLWPRSNLLDHQIFLQNPPNMQQGIPPSPSHTVSNLTLDTEIAEIDAVFLDPKNSLDGSDCFDQPDVSDEVMIWWDCDVAEKSFSSSCNLTSVFQPSFMVPDHVTGYEN